MTICSRPLAIVVLMAVSLGYPHMVMAEGRDQLLALVPENTALCLVVNELRDHSKYLENTRWVQKLLRSPLGRALTNNSDFSKIGDINSELKRHLQINVNQLRDEILGDCVVMAFNPSSDENSDDDRGVILLWTKNPQLLQQVIERINVAQEKNGELKLLETLKYKGVSYVHRKDRMEDQYYFQNGQMFVFSGHADILQGVIDRHLAKSLERAESQVMRSFRQLPTDNALMTFWINPRAFEDALAAEHAKSDDKKALATLMQYWKAMDSMAISLVLRDNIEMRLSFQGKMVDLPTSSQKFLTTFLTDSDLWQYFPRKAMLTIAARCDSDSMLKILEGFLSEDQRVGLHQALQKNIGAALGMNFVEEALPFVGPDLGLSVANPNDGHAIPHGIFALRLQSGPEQSRVNESLYKAMQFFIGLAVFDYNRKHDVPVRIRSEVQGSHEVKYLEHKNFPVGFRPAYTYKEGYLLMASSPSAIKRFAKRTSTENANNRMLVLSFVEVATYFNQHGETLINWAVQNQKLSGSMSQNWLRGVASSLELFHSLELHQETQRGQVTWALRLSMR